MSMVINRGLESGRRPFQLKDHTVVPFSGHLPSPMARDIRDIIGNVLNACYGIDRNVTAREAGDAVDSGGTILLVKPKEPQEADYVGFGTFRTIVTPTFGGERRTLYMTRALKVVNPEGQDPLNPHNKNHAGQGVGRALVALGLWGREDIDFLALRTQNPASILSVQKSGVILPGTLFPIDHDYTKDPFMSSILEEVASQTGQKGRVDLKYGLCKDVYPEGTNRAYVPNEKHLESMRLYERMRDEFKLDFANGDALYVISRV
jgi:hypothetical protein